MELFGTIALCLLASIGAVQALGWLLGWLVRPEPPARGYHVILLSPDPAAVEAQLRYELLSLRWSMSCRQMPLFLLDTGLGPEALAVCERMLRGVGGVWLCAPGDLPGLIGRGDDFEGEGDLHCPEDGL